MKMPLPSLGLALATTIIACADPAAVASGAESLMDGCSGTYTCVDQKASQTLLHKNGDVCMMNSYLTLNPDGTALLNGQPCDATWSGNAQSFQYCQLPGVCATCTPQVATADAGGGGTAGGKCTGSTYGCGGQSPPYCSDVSGCYMATRIGPNNSFENYCTGYADSCDDMSTEASCKKQGCTWKP